MAIELPNHDISDVSFVWTETSYSKDILFYKRGYTVTEKKTTTEIKSRRPDIPAWEKSNLTIDEASVYFNIGKDKLREMTDREDCPFVLWIGSKRLIRKKKFEDYLDKAFSI